MSALVRSAFWLASIGSVLLMAGFVIPFWMARIYDEASSIYWGLWYTVNCQNNCTLVAGILDEGSIIINQDWRFPLLVIPILSSVGLALAYLAVVILELMSCSCCRTGCCGNPQGVITFCAILLLLAGLVVTVDVILSLVALNTFFKDDKMESVKEFPWSVLLYGVGDICLYIAAFMYIAIACNWRQYSEAFEGKDWTDSDHTDDGPAAGRYQRWLSTSSGNRSSRRSELTLEAIQREQSQKHYNASVMADSGYDFRLNSSLNGKKRSNRDLRDSSGSSDAAGPSSDLRRSRDLRRSNSSNEYSVYRDKLSTFLSSSGDGQTSRASWNKMFPPVSGSQTLAAVDERH